MQPFDPQSRQAGFSLTEVLVVLAILSLAVGVFAATRPGGTTTLQFEERLSSINADASAARTMAVRSGSSAELVLTQDLCSGDEQALTFFSDGTAIGAEICVALEGRSGQLFLDPLTALVLREPPA